VVIVKLQKWILLKIYRNNKFQNNDWNVIKRIKSLVMGAMVNLPWSHSVQDVNGKGFGHLDDGGRRYRGIVKLFVHVQNRGVSEQGRHVNKGLQKRRGKNKKKIKKLNKLRRKHDILNIILEHAWKVVCT